MNNKLDEEEIPAYSDSLFTLRFLGEEFNKRGASLYDLGVVFIAFQRLINKTYLLEEGRLEKGAFPRKGEREMLALQIGSRVRKSDGFGLIPVLTDPATLEVVKWVSEQVFQVLALYVIQDVANRLREEPDEDKRFFIASIHSEVDALTGRIGAAGGVDKIEIDVPSLGKRRPLVFDLETKKYVRKLAGEEFLGKQQSIRGILTKLLTTSGTVEVRRPGGSLVKVRLSSTLFDEIRYDTTGYQMIEFDGRPVYPISATSSKIYEFEAYQIRFIPPEE